MQQITPEHLPEVISQIIEQIADDKAARLKTLSKATVIMQITPEWVRLEEANALFGLPNNQVLDLARTGKVAARKTDPGNKKSATIFKVIDLRRVVESEMTPYDKWLKERPDLEKKSA